MLYKNCLKKSNILNFVLALFLVQVGNSNGCSYVPDILLNYQVGGRKRRRKNKMRLERERHAEGRIGRRMEK